MNKNCFFILILFFMLSCTRNENKTGPGNSIAPRIKRQVMSLAIDYARHKITNAKEIVMKDGIVNIGDNQIKYIIDPSRIVTGLIDDDENEDAIVSIPSYKGQFLIKTEHLILIKSDGKFKVKMVQVADMKILEIKENIIFAEISKYASDSPNYDCPICKEVVKYKYLDGGLVRTE